jgi:sulfur-oxidizing protein SoxA
MIRLLSLACCLVAALPVLAAEIKTRDRRSGFDFMTPSSQDMQRDDMLNPGMLWVLEGEALWQQQAANAPSCAGCHGDAKDSMRGAAARYPAFNDRLNRPINLQQRINLCRSKNQQQPAFEPESRPLLALSAFIGAQSRGLPIAPPEDARLAPHLENGRLFFKTPMGQLGLSCAQCHDDNWGGRLAGAPIPQAHPTGYPIYRLEWQTLGSLQRRLRNCLTGIRAEPFDWDAPEMVELELYLMKRAAGMNIETPAVRP